MSHASLEVRTSAKRPSHSNTTPTAVRATKNEPDQVFAEKTGHAQRPVPLRRGVRLVHAQTAVSRRRDRPHQGRTGAGRVRRGHRRRRRVRSRRAPVRPSSEIVRPLDEYSGVRRQVDDEAEQRRSGVPALRPRGVEQNNRRRRAGKPTELHLRQGVRDVRARGRRDRQRRPDVRRQAQVCHKHELVQPGRFFQQEMEPRW